VLALAGGLNDLAQRKVTIQRHASKERVDYVLSNSANAALDANVPVYPGDTVLVPKADVVYVLGDVNRPGGIAIVTNDSKLSALQALTLAGGTPPNAVPAHSRLIRKQADGTHVEIPLQLSAMQKGKEPDIPLQGDDIIYVPFSYARNMAVGAGSLVGATSSAAIYRF
jgi:polysaccharide export outer membrane protein